MNVVFGVGTGRCGSLALVNLLNCSPSVLALHEGQLRAPLLLEPVKTYLPKLTLENLAAYLDPPGACELLRSCRQRQLLELFAVTKKHTIAEAAYYLAPFTAVIPTIFPESKLIFLVRHGADFVRSVYTDESPDPTPVGYTGRRDLSPVERFIEAGRLKMRDVDEPASVWHTMSAFQRNVWLWAETNRLILDALPLWPPEQVLLLKLEQWRGNPEEAERIFDFLELADVDRERLARVLSSPINPRRHCILPPPCQWEPQLKAQFQVIAGDVMSRLGYLL